MGGTDRLVINKKISDKEECYTGIKIGRRGRLTQHGPGRTSEEDTGKLTLQLWD